MFNQKFPKFKSGFAKFESKICLHGIASSISEKAADSDDLNINVTFPKFDQSFAKFKLGFAKF